MKARITIQDWQLLSAYMDDQLAPREKQALEARLEKDPELHAEYLSMRQTRAMLRAAPRHKAPRSFALTPEQARQYTRRKSFLFPALSFSSAISALLLIITLLTRLTPAAGLRMMTADEAPQAEMLAAEPAAMEATIPPIIIWGESNLNAPLMANGRGGSGGGGDGFSFNTMPMPEEPAASAPSEKGAEESLLSPVPTQVVEMPAPMPAEGAPQAESFSGEAQPSSPILGIAPEQEQGLITGMSATAVSSEPQPLRQSDTGMQLTEAIPYILAVIAAGSALAAFWLRRKGLI